MEARDALIQRVDRGFGLEIGNGRIADNGRAGRGIDRRGQTLGRFADNESLFDLRGLLAVADGQGDDILARLADVELRCRSGVAAQERACAIEAVLPAGTLSGAPKIRACQLIGELENNKRGIYGGAIGYIDFTGNMDTCIAIRIAYKKNGRVFVRSGAGIVADSVPETEYQECINKAKAVVSALTLAQEEDL